ncbi:MAG: hypothetical protein QMD85_00045 [Candidatus Aenigmarchaeota archaeon]|nr:hypothetical protein [Candidatus Aenigmarchaeota archaeon]MDI6721919.1 hypothetical protein [Candidatus Aenigmarchaeota archaeon]
MGWKDYFDADLRTTLAFAALGIIAGFVSFEIKNNIGSFLLMLVFLAAGKFGMQRIVKEKKDMKWWLGNGIIVYIFVWFVMWTVFYNIMV